MSPAVFTLASANSDRHICIENLQCRIKIWHISNSMLFFSYSKLIDKDFCKNVFLRFT